MTNQELRTLAYTKSPKNTKRTTFQDELQAAISDRARKITMDDYSDDFSDEEDDFLNNIFNSRKNRIDAFKSSKTKTVNFELPDDEDKPIKSKRLSFLKTKRISSPLKSTLTDEQNKNQHSNSSTDGEHTLLCSKHSTNVSDHSSDKRSVESTNSEDTQDSTNRPLPHQKSEDVLQDMPVQLPSNIIVETPDSLATDRNGTTEPLTTPLKQSAVKELPTPKPRQRVLAVTNYIKDNQSESQNQPPFSTSAPLSCQLAEGRHAALSSSNQSSLSMGKHSPLKTTVDSGSKDGFNSDDSRDHGLPFEELTITHPSATEEDSRDHVHCSSNQLNSHVSDNSHDTLTSGTNAKRSQKSRSVCPKKVDSKYLGSLKVLDYNISLQDSEPQSADTLRAVVYQEWLKKKKEESRLNVEVKKKEQIIEEKQKEGQEAQKKEDAIVSYEAWKEKKLESLKVKTKEKQEQRRKEQKAKEEKEEKRQTAKQVFKKWKDKHDHLLKEKYTKARKDETELKLQKQEKEEERKRSSKLVFSEWSEKKKNILHERAIAKHKELKDNTEAERYIKEERDQMALDMYESWLARKNLEKKRHKEERWLQGILQDSPPPPWSPPNKTIPHGK